LQVALLGVGQGVEAGDADEGQARGDQAVLNQALAALTGSTTVLEPSAQNCKDSFHC
jgi:hypothetical protein